MNVLLGLISFSLRLSSTERPSTTGELFNQYDHKIVSFNSIRYPLSGAMGDKQEGAINLAVSFTPVAQPQEQIIQQQAPTAQIVQPPQPGFLVDSTEYGLSFSSSPLY